MMAMTILKAQKNNHDLVYIDSTDLKNAVQGYLDDEINIIPQPEHKKYIGIGLKRWILCKLEFSCDGYYYVTTAELALERYFVKLPKETNTYA